jgi:hypothetical protein
MHPFWTIGQEAATLGHVQNALETPCWDHTPTEVSMWKVWLAVALNFFFPGAGYLLLGHRVVLAIMWLAGVIGLTYVEFGIQVAAPPYYLPMFVSVLVMNAAFAVDAYLVGRARFQDRASSPAT